MLKNKRILLTILLVLVAIMLLQLQANATETDYSEYDYLLTETGVINKANLTGTETVIAGIKGEYTGEITADSTNKKVTINNFTADKLVVFNYEYTVWIDGENSVYEIDFGFNKCYGDGTILTKTGSMALCHPAIIGEKYMYR